MTGEIPNLYAPVCPTCAGNNIVFKQRDIKVLIVAGFNEYGDLEYLPEPESIDMNESLCCRDCYSEFDHKTLYSATFVPSATFAPEEDDDGSAPPF